MPDNSSVNSADTPSNFNVSQTFNFLITESKSEKTFVLHINKVHCRHHVGFLDVISNGDEMVFGFNKFLDISAQLSVKEIKFLVPNILIVDSSYGRKPRTNAIIE